MTAIRFFVLSASHTTGLLILGRCPIPGVRFYSHGCQIGLARTMLIPMVLQDDVKVARLLVEPASIN